MNQLAPPDKLPHQTAFLGRWLRTQLHAHQFWLMAAFSVFAVGLLLSRIYVLGTWRFLFLIWNLFLAWLPYGFGLVGLLCWHRSFRGMAAVMGVLWLLFFPNAPYLLTDLMHIRRSAYLVWFDTLLLTTFALLGLFLGLVSLRMMHEWLKSEVAPFWGWCVLVSVMFLSGFAIYIGRFLRWNSWDALLRPWSLLGDLFEHVWVAGKGGRLLLVTTICFVLQLVAYLLFYAQEDRGKHRLGESS